MPNALDKILSYKGVDYAGLLGAVATGVLVSRYGRGFFSSSEAHVKAMLTTGAGTLACWAGTYHLLHSKLKNIPDALPAIKDFVGLQAPKYFTSFCSTVFFLNSDASPEYLSIALATGTAAAVCHHLRSVPMKKLDSMLEGTYLPSM